MSILAESYAQTVRRATLVVLRVFVGLTWIQTGLNKLAREGGRRTRTVNRGILAGAVALAACNGDPTEPGTGAFSFAVSGDVTRTIEGDDASFGPETLPITDTEVWSLHLRARAGLDLDEVSFVKLGPGRLGEGTHALAAAELPHLLGPNEVGAFLVLALEADPPAFMGSSVSGTLTITTSHTDRMRGTVELEAEGTLFFADRGPENGSVTLSGEFDAAPAP